MARTLVDSSRVLEQVRQMRPLKKIRTILHRGNYPRNTFLVVYEDESSETLTVPPISKHRTKKSS